MRRAFTLIELLVVVAIMATMISVGVVSLNASRGSTRVFGAARDVLAMVRTARSMALVTQRPVVLTYENHTVGGEACAKVEMQADKIFSSKKPSEAVYTLSGEVVREASAVEEGETGGETLEDILSPREIPADVLQGLCIKVIDESAQLSLPENETRRSKISIFSTADNISRTLTPASETIVPSGASEGEVLIEEESVKVAFSANGMVTPPHRIWIYRAGSSPEKGLSIRVDRFGEAKCDDFE